MLKLICILLCFIPTLSYSADGIFTNLKATNARFTNFSTQNGKFHGTSTGTFIGSGTLTGNIIGNVTGNVTGDITTTKINNTVFLSRFSNLSAAKAAIGSTPTKLILDVPYTTNTLTTPSTLQLEAELLGIGTINSGKSLTINGPFSAGLYQVFAGSGAVTGLKEAKPEWWGVDGTDDHVQINKALGAAKTGLLSKKYTVAATGTSITMNPGNRLIGVDSAEIYSDAVPNNTANIYVVMVPSGADGCEISGIAFRGNGSTAAGNSYPSAIRVEKADYTSIHNNSFDGISWGVSISDADGVGASNPIGTKITNNTFYDMTGPVADKGGYGVLCTFNDSTIITNNNFEGTSRHCIYLSAATRRANVSGNICKGSEYAPISLFAGTTVGNEVYDNVITGNQFIGLGTALANSHGIPMTGNIYNNTISNNIVKNARNYGLMMQAASATQYPHDNVISGNIIVGSQSFGMSIDDGVNNLFSGNIIKDNGADGTALYEVFIGKTSVTGAGYNKLVGNKITPSGAAIRYSVVVGANSNYNDLTGNTMTPGTFGIVDDLSGTTKITADNPGIQTVIYGATVSLDPTLGELVDITLTGNITIGIDSVKKAKGQRITLRITQDGTGGRAVTLSTAFKSFWSNTGNTAGKVQVATFTCVDGVSFVQTSAATGWYTP